MNRLVKLNNIPDLNQLLSFYWVYVCEGVSSAAIEKGVSRSAISQSLSALENETKLNLFKRVNRKMVPTEAGNELFEMISPFLISLDHRFNELKEKQSCLSGRIRIAAPPIVSKKLLVPTIGIFSKQHPQVTFELLGSDESSLNLLHDDLLDLCVLDSPDLGKRNMSSFRSRLLQEDEEYLISSPSFLPKNNRFSHTFDELKDLPFLSYFSDGRDIRSWFLRHFGRSPNPRVLFNSPQIGTLVEALKAGLGLAIIPKDEVSSELKDRSLALVKIQSTKAFTNKVILLQQKGKLETKVERLFVDLLVKNVKELR